MRFTVRGADAATARDVILFVEAASADEAGAKANAKGVFVASVQAERFMPLPPAEHHQLVQQPEQVTRSRPQRRRVLLAVTGAVGFVALLTWWQSVKDRLLPLERTTSIRTQDPVSGAPDPNTPAGEAAAPALVRRDTTTPAATPRTEALRGTFGTAPGAETDLSITFDYPRYQLNPSRSHRWSAGATGNWQLQTDHPSLTADQRAFGLCVLMMTRPDDDSIWLPGHVRFAFDHDGELKELQFFSFMGAEVPPDKQMTLIRQNRTMNGASAQAGVTAPTGEPPGLGRAGYVRGRCLICRQARSALSQSRYSDRRGFGLCDDCGAGYRAWERLLASAESSYQPTDVDQQHTRDFNQRLMQHFHRSDDEGRRGIALFMLTGKFASSEWHTLTGSD